MSAVLEEWRPAPDFDLYEVSSLGRIRRVKVTRNHKPVGVVTPRLNKNGYLQATLSNGIKKVTIYLHRLVCKAFKGPPANPKLQCRHVDGIKTNCRQDNLVWGTRKENEADKIAHGTSNRGERHGLSKLNENQVLEIKEQLASGKNQRSLAKEY